MPRSKLSLGWDEEDKGGELHVKERWIDLYLCKNCDQPVKVIDNELQEGHRNRFS
jgi:uncharacterized protein YlaI